MPGERPLQRPRLRIPDAKRLFRRARHDARAGGIPGVGQPALIPLQDMHVLSRLSIPDPTGAVIHRGRQEEGAAVPEHGMTH